MKIKQTASSLLLRCASLAFVFTAIVLIAAESAVDLYSIFLVLLAIWLDQFAHNFQESV